MPSRIILFFLILTLSLQCSLTTVYAGETLISENFDKLDLKALPAGWSVFSNDLSLVDEPGRGKVLKIAHAGNSFPNLAIMLDLNKVKGHQVRVSVASKFPGTYTPIPGKDWAHPKLQVHIKDGSGKDIDNEQPPQPGVPTWQDLQMVANIPADAQAAQVFLRIDLVAAEVYFDNLVIELDPAGVPPAPAVAQAQAQNPPAPAAPTPGAPAPAAPADTVSTQAPKKTLDDGVLFNPDIAAAMQKLRGKGPAVANTLLYIGPALPIKELEGTKAPEKWTLVPTPKELTGPTATPRNLLMILPEYLAQLKPEVVVLIGDFAPARKLPTAERQDWQDLAGVCVRMGVIPIFGVPGAGGGQDVKSELYSAISGALTDVGCPAIDCKAPNFIARRTATMADLLDKFVFARVSPDAKSNKPGED